MQNLGIRSIGVTVCLAGVLIANAPAVEETVSFYGGQVLARKAPEGQWQWHPLAVGAGGQNCGLTFDPTNANRIYLRIDVSGVIKTQDAGDHWRNVNDGLQGLSEGQYGIGAIAVDPRSPNVVYASIGRMWRPGGGIVKSTDYGESWRFLSGEVCVYGEGPGKCGGPGILVDPRDSSRLYAIDNSHDTPAGGVWISTDGGLRWTASGLRKTLVFTIRFEPGNPDALYACAVKHDLYPGGMWRSDDRGQTWRKIGLQDKSVYNFQFETGNPRTIYAVCGPEGIYKTSDGGKTWKGVNNGLPLASEGAKGNDFDFDRFDYEYVALDVNPKRPGHLLTAARVIRAFYESLDGGESWKPMDIRTVRPPRGWMLDRKHMAWQTNQIYFKPNDPKTLFFCDIFGTWKSPDSGKTWTINPYGQESSCMVTVLPDAKISRRLYLGIWDHNILIYLDDEKSPQALRPKGLIHGVPGTNAHISGIAQDGENPDNLLCVSNSTYLFLSRDRGLNWTRMGKGFPSQARFRVGCPAVASEAGLYFVPVNEAGVYASKDRGETWIRLPGKGLKPISVTGQWSPTQNVFAVRPDASLLAMVSKSELFLSVDKGYSWETPSIPARANSVALAENIYLGCDDGLYASSDRGKSWNRICPRRDGVGLLAVDPKDSNRILCHTSAAIKGAPDRIDYALMYTEDGGKTWGNLFNPSLAVWRLQGVAFDPFDRNRIYANTYWAGAWVAERPGRRNAK